MSEKLGRHTSYGASENSSVDGTTTRSSEPIISSESHKIGELNEESSERGSSSSFSSKGFTNQVTNGMTRLANTVRKGIAGGLDTRIRRLEYNVSDPSPPEFSAWVSKKSRKGRKVIIDKMRRRYARLQGGYMRYYAKYDMLTEEASNEKGSVFLGDCFVEDPIMSVNPTVVYISLSTLEGKYEDHLIFTAEDEEEANLWRENLRKHIEYADKITKSVRVHVKGQMVDLSELGGEDFEDDGEAVKREYEGTAPDDLHGWFMKEARGQHMLPTIGGMKRRYIVLSEGVIYYYCGYDEEQSEPIDLKGTMILNECTVDHVPKKNKIIIDCIDNQKKRLVLFLIDDPNAFYSMKSTSLEAWHNALTEHIKFANLNYSRIQTNMDLMTNRLAAFRDKSYAYTISGLYDNVVTQISTVATNTAYTEFFNVLYQTYKFVVDDPFSNRVLGFLTSLLISIYGNLQFIFSLLSFNLVLAFISFCIWISGMFWLSFEIQFQFLPERFYKFAYHELRCLFTPYGRCHCYLFLSILIGSYGGSYNVYTTEISIVACYLTFNSLWILGLTWRIKYRLKQIKEENIKGSVLKYAFNSADEQKKGQLNSVEFRNFLNSVGIKLQEDELEIALQELDRNNNFEISWKEFIEWYCSKGGFLGTGF